MRRLVVAFVLLLPIHVAHAEHYRFEFDPANRGTLADGIDVHSVAVAGSFNNWDKGRLLDRQSDGTFAKVMDVPPGAVHSYKIVINANHWIEDPKADPKLRQPDNYGGFNSGLVVGDFGGKFGAAKPDHITEAALKHDPATIDYFNVSSSVDVSIRLRTLEKDVERVQLFHTFAGESDDPKGSPALSPVIMRRQTSKLGFDFYSAEVRIPPGAKSMTYYFHLVDGKQERTFGAGIGQSPAARGDFEMFRTPLTQSFPTPAWARHVVWYQIMIDRFRNGDPGNDPDGSVPWRWDWAKPYAEYEKGSSYGKYWDRQFGGDLQGLIDSLDYLEELGVTGIYLNPIFKARGYAKYNPTDFRHIDDHFGRKGDFDEAQKRESIDPATWTWTPSDTLFLRFLDIAHARGFRVIIDGVFNHAGEDFWAFRDVVKNEHESPYADWFSVTDWDANPRWNGGPAFDYKGWGGFGGLPEFAEDDGGIVPGVRDHIFDITRRWMDPNGDGDASDGVDGWRLDAADAVSPAFWEKWRRHAKNISPDAYLCGEIWGTTPEVLTGRHFDALMNYPFAMNAIRFFVHSPSSGSAYSPTQFDRSIRELLDLYPRQVSEVMMNLYASHDVDRLASIVKNPNRDYDARNRPHENAAYDISRPSDADYAVVRLMMTFQMTWIGAPMVWYGDEVGMYGADDPANRMPMWWGDLMPYDNPDDSIRKDLHDHMRRLISIRNTFPALRTGAGNTFMADDSMNVLAYERHVDPARPGDAGILVILNNDKSPHTVRMTNSKSVEYVDLLDPASTSYAKGPVEGLRAQRPLVHINADARRTRPSNGVLRVDLPPKSAAILVEISE